MSGANRIRRITKDQRSLRASPPLDYLFFDSPNSSSSNSAASLNEDITTVDVFLLGPAATAYENGVFRVSLKLGSTYPNEPPTACFRTKIFHPNINESNGDVCVDTLKNGWTSALNLVDVLSTIRCLLIHPNPSSALNSEAALLADTDYKAFEKQAKLFTKIYAAVSPEMKTVVKEAREARSKGSGESKPSGSKAKRPQKGERAASMPTPPSAPTSNPSLSSEEKNAAAAAVESTPAKIDEEGRAGVEKEENDEQRTDDSGKENTTSGHANNAAASTATTTPKRPVSKKRSFDAVFEKPNTSTNTTTTSNKKRLDPSSNKDASPAPLLKKVLRSDTRKLSANAANAKGRSVSLGGSKAPAAARKGLKRL